MMLALWLSSQFTWFCMVVWVAIRDGIEPSKDNIMMIFIMTLFGPLTLIAVFGLVMYETRQTNRRYRCARIMTQWEMKARESSESDKYNRWDWYASLELQEDRYNLLRETIRLVSDKDLYTLS